MGAKKAKRSSFARSSLRAILLKVSKKYMFNINQHAAARDYGICQNIGGQGGGRGRPLGGEPVGIDLGEQRPTRQVIKRDQVAHADPRSRMHRLVAHHT